MIHFRSFLALCSPGFFSCLINPSARPYAAGETKVFSQIGGQQARAARATQQSSRQTAANGGAQKFADLENSSCCSKRESDTLFSRVALRCCLKTCFCRLVAQYPWTFFYEARTTKNALVYPTSVRKSAFFNCCTTTRLQLRKEQYFVFTCLVFIFRI